jgi:hypothetical protein
MGEFRTYDVCSVMVFTALCCAVASCGSSAEESQSSVAHSLAPSSVSASAIDACSLLSADDVAALLNTTVEGQPTGGGLAPSDCTWQNPTTYESVSVEIGTPGTVVNNTLPPPPPDLPEVATPTPGPDGMRFLGSGTVEFPASGRSNTVQVAVLRMSGDECNAAAVELARKIAPQIPN